ncbi:hypothetical protein AW736_14040 [Termitidicoccus mucosus]|uniref:TrwC relaxase domain-containing protein n=1 Tax=Termitidicoccus mucosus TaxID=1184151 RepID=A0A178IJA1_9BACT|nr:hypothetical protein AW736_14040 [Opitutaceae bacterium TSB47]
MGDYYMDGHVVAGEWRGVAASMLGRESVVDEKSFLGLCDGLHPETGQRLTARRNTTWRDANKTVSNHRVFYDFTISPPKSVSVIALYQDARIIELHDRVVRVMVDELEKFAETRVRKDGANIERETGGVIAALFRHDTNRLSAMLFEMRASQSEMICLAGALVMAGASVFLVTLRVIPRIPGRKFPQKEAVCGSWFRAHGPGP